MKTQTETPGVKTAGETFYKSRELFFAAYQDSRWKKFAAAARRVYGDQCYCCRSAGGKNHVHHWRYYPGRMPWEYNFSEVTVLCVSCHSILHDRLQEFRQHVFPKVTAQAFAVLNAALVVGLSKSNPLTLAYAIAELVSSPSAIERFASEWKPSTTGNLKQQKS